MENQPDPTMGTIQWTDGRELQPNQNRQLRGMSVICAETLEL
jgi:hypothetical protein